MTAHIRNQLSPYCITVRKITVHRNMQFEDIHFEPAMHTPGPVPHGRHDHTGEPGDWGPDVYGYTDFDDYHLALYGA